MEINVYWIQQLARAMEKLLKSATENAVSAFEVVKIKLLELLECFPNYVWAQESRRKICLTGKTIKQEEKFTCKQMLQNVCSLSVHTMLFNNFFG